MFTSFSTVAISLLITFTIAVRVPSGKRTHLSPKSTRIFHKRRLNQSLPCRGRRSVTKSFNKGKRDGEAIIQCRSETSFSLCYSDGTQCTESQNTAFGTICVDGGIQLSKPLASPVNPPTAASALPYLPSSIELESATNTPVVLATSSSEQLPTQSSGFKKVIALAQVPIPTTSIFVPPPPVVTPVKGPTSSVAHFAAPLSNSGSSEVFTGGRGTFYNQEGGIGACGKSFTDSDFIVAIALARYGTGSNNAPDCGKIVRITNPATGLSVDAKVTDACPGCANINSIDLSVAAFNAIAKPETGVIDIIWNFV